MKNVVNGVMMNVLRMNFVPLQQTEVVKEACAHSRMWSVTTTPAIPKELGHQVDDVGSK